MKNLKGILVVLIGVPLLIWGLNILIFPKNDGEKYVDEYINNSVVINVEDSDIDFEFKIKTVYTGIQTAFLRGKISGRKVKTMSFYDKNYKKYFMLFDILYKPTSGTIIKANVNKYDLDSPDYGTKENPIPIFMLDIPKYADNPSYMKAKITDEQYCNTVKFYLSYMMSKREFKKRFEKNN
ncbi:hypothetical protein M2132_001963 [Dysgonomonas sp. PH5-45]|uniref:hypothetical protein n=1 Tax=unclassified Dysgonomonas TaxID=2630389 RepID=UPI0024730AC9|nr:MULTISPECIES: hypothetical protein [unclassified Dysgonomonas]MDH6355618.1 hypothetical protein [Dysgonomonas sp. PH5-45]MDH6388515.1 hypothetical protein [Dysgonomonas sp. PH5-37]